LATVAKLIGGAGTGKTTELMRIMGEVIGHGVDPFEIGYVSFTKAAIMEAAGRVEQEFGVAAEHLTKQGWFRTLHSVCYQSLGSMAKGLLTDRKADREWLEGVLQEHVGEVVKAIDDDQGSGVRAMAMDAQSPASNALRIWAMARSRLCTIDEVVAELLICGETPPPVEYCRKIAHQYERSKYLDDRVDFADLAGRFAGWRWNPDGDHDWFVDPMGETPNVRVWFFDEHQDVSRLLNSVARRLTNSPSCQWAYFSGDPFQSIFGFGGADMNCFLDIEADRERTMERSFRCPENVLRLGERALSRCSNYFDRGIAPNEPGGLVDFSYRYRDLLTTLDLSATTILTARTNQLASRFIPALDESAIPWMRTESEHGYLSKGAKTICFFLRGLEMDMKEQIPRKFPIGSWLSLIEKLPVGKGESALFSRGTKTAAKAGTLGGDRSMVTYEDLASLGATDYLLRTIATGQWSNVVEGGERFRRAVAAHGMEVAMEPKVRVGTIHSVKGSEADTVVMLDSLTRRCDMSRRVPAGRDEEQRVAYVGITRAKKRLHILRQQSDRWRMDIE